MADLRGIVREGSSSLVSRVDRRRQLVAFGTISGLVLLAFGLWFVAILTSSDRDQLEIAEGPTADAERPVAEEDDDEAPDERPEGEAAVEESDREAPDPTTEKPFDPEPDTDADADAEPDTDADADTEPDTDADTDTGSGTITDPEGDTGSGDDTDPEPDRAPEPDIDGRDDAENTDDPAVEAVTIDGVCKVELDAAERDAAPLRAWEYADCAYAPVPLDDGGERWIVIRASMPSGDVDAAAAQERARDLGVDGGVLWSSHYPSLNPDFWVAYDGPFPDAEAALDAAEAVDGEAYPRALTTDDGDR